MTDDKKAAYETLFECLNVTAQLMSPVAPFFADWLYTNLTDNIRQAAMANHTPLRFDSVHLTSFTVPEQEVIDEDLNASMELAQIASSLVLSLRKKENIKVRQPLSRVIIPVLDPAIEKHLRKVEDLVRSEVNVKAIEYLKDTEGLIKKRIKPDFKALGPRLGPRMKHINQAFGNFSHEDIVAFERLGYHDFNIEGESIRISVDEAEISTEDIPGWLVASEGNLTVALDITITPELVNEGHARELVNRIQRLRKDSDFNVTDRIRIYLSPAPELESAVVHFKDYICAETLAEGLEFREKLPNGVSIEVNEIPVNITIETV
jgi:isoleucyl-tRNA synthetase